MMFQGGPIHNLAPFSSHARPQKMALKEHTHAADKTSDLRSQSTVSSLNSRTKAWSPGFNSRILMGRARKKLSSNTLSCGWGN